MEKQKRWQFYLILAVLVLTLYNILPTIFYYTKPLKDPVDAERAKEISLNIVDRVDHLEADSQAWLRSFCKLLHIKPVSIQIKESDPGVFAVTFANERDAATFKRFLPQAGALIPFVPKQLELNPALAKETSQTVYVQRKVGVQLDPKEIDQIFHFSFKRSPDGHVSDLYRTIVYDRASYLAWGLAGPSKNARQIAAIVDSPADGQYDDLIVAVAREMVDADHILGKGTPLAKRYFAGFSQIARAGKGDLIQKFAAQLDNLKTRITSQRDDLLAEQKKLKEDSKLLDTAQQQQLALLDNQRKVLESASLLLKKNSADFKAGHAPLKQDGILETLSKASKAEPNVDSIQTLNLSGYNPFVQSLQIDWENDTIKLKLYDDVQAYIAKEGKTESDAFAKEKFNQMLINEIARIAQLTDEKISPNEDYFAVSLNSLTNSQSFLTMDLGYLAEKQSSQIKNEILSTWSPKHADFASDNYPVRDYTTYKKSKAEDQKLGIVVYAPAMYQSAPAAGFRPNSIYVIAKGLDSILQKYRALPNAEGGQVLMNDFNTLQSILQQSGFIGYPGSSYGLAPEFSKDYIFELSDYYGYLLQATREAFSVRGDKRYAVLEFTDVEQRILTTNKIEDRMQEDLLKWYEEYQSAQVDLNATSKYTVPKPTQNVYWANFKLSLVKYFRGDERKILKWGLDLSGGKTVRIGLRDQNNRVVTDPVELKQAVNELYTRINKMGVSERTIRIENENILLDFPGSQGLSATDLVKASAMSFHIVNEKFSPSSPTLGETVNRFLQDVWNEAVVTNRKDSEGVNEIAWQHMGGDVSGGMDNRPVSENARILYDSGLRLADPKKSSVSGAFNDTLSSVAVFRGDDSAAWQNQAQPLLFVFHNYALEGSSLTNIQGGYDPSEGNILMFGVKSSYEGSRQKAGGSPRDDFHTWTSAFAEEKIVGTPKEVYTKGRGWRMAVILNGTVITAPALRAALSNQATISGRFTQREINQLVADLKAGSLSFTPRILSEQNVSPELGKEERTKGVVASLTALALVAAAMIGYYRFAGFVAICAVLLNLLIMWGVLQNIGAALTLPGIAAIVLTIGMAIDANVLVFERVREEFRISGRIASALQAGYRKAFSAIIDSNLTTIIAAIILIQFDSGPIKGFAILLIIGIISSMFTSLFMTRYFFAGWVRNPAHKSLKMGQFFQETHFDFLGKIKPAMIITLILLVIGGFFLVKERHTILGMDFTGGYSLSVQLEEKPNTDYRIVALNALQAAGATRSDIEVRELSRPNQLRIQLGMGMEQPGHPFYGLPERLEDSLFTQEYQHNPRIIWVLDALKAKGLQPAASQMDALGHNWSVMSGQLSDSMRNNAIIALSIALLSVMLYITFRFEFKFAIGAVVGLVHDVILTMGVLAVFHWMGFAVQIDLQVVGAIMTIIGYSLNDTIIVFDRIREDIKVLRKLKFHDIVNHALNVTLSRTIMTSGTTLMVLLALVFLGGSSIFAFSLVMTIGVLVGTFSSLFIAAPVMIYFHDREEKNNSSAVAWKKA